MSIIVGIDASRNRSGGAIIHLIGLLSIDDLSVYGIDEVHVWSYPSLLDALPDYSWLIKHSPVELSQPLWRQLWWQYHRLPLEARAARCFIMLNTDAGSVGSFKPCVVISQDMLSYEKGELWRNGISKATLRLLMLRFVQSYAMKRANGVIFLTQYAAKIIQRYTGMLANTTIIPHGLGQNFKDIHTVTCPLSKQALRCLYVSNVAPYKHQWQVVKAIEILRNKGYKLSLRLVGGGSGKAQKRLDRTLQKHDPNGVFVEQYGIAKHSDVPQLLSEADIFVFASSCENMPNTLIEAMASGLPIACSKRGPMPEVLEDGGLYFDPENPHAIAEAIEQLMLDPDLRQDIAARAKERSNLYSWTRCAHETWTYIQQQVERAHQKEGLLI